MTTLIRNVLIFALQTLRWVQRNLNKILLSLLLTGWIYGLVVAIFVLKDLTIALMCLIPPFAWLVGLTQIIMVFGLDQYV